MMDNWHIHSETCKQCGICVEICPSIILDRSVTGEIFFREDHLDLCFRCGHCMAVCPTRSINIPGLSYDIDFYNLPDSDPNSAANLTNLIATRRAIRVFQNRPVPRDLLEKVIEAIQSAPPSFPPVKTEITVISDPSVLRDSLQDMITSYVNLVKGMENPIGRQFIKHSVGKEKFQTLKEHVVPLMISRLPGLISGKEDTILRGAPAMILFHADRHTENFRTDIHFALTYGMLAAHSLGLGATPIDLIPPVVERNPNLRKRFQIPEGNEVVGALILGFPKVKFLRGIRRSLKSVTWIGSVNHA